MMNIIGLLARLLLCAMCLSIAHAKAQNHTSSFGFSSAKGGLSGIAEVQYSNNYDGVLDFTCPSGHAVYYIHSVHDNYYEDRKWTMHCRKTVRIGYPVTCEWKTDDNWSWDSRLHFRCPWNQYIGGVHSRHDNYYEDREWKFYCCSAPCHAFGSRYYTPLSGYDAEFTREVPGSEDIFRGFFGKAPNNYYEDREWFFETRPFGYSPCDF